eukprot:364174-Chlamydomonas_euryale.AAC.7
MHTQTHAQCCHRGEPRPGRQPAGESDSASRLRRDHDLQERAPVLGLALSRLDVRSVDQAWRRPHCRVFAHIHHA